MNTFISTPTRRLCPYPARSAGFTLIEMMISITIGLGILAGLVGVLATNSGNSKSNDRTAELMTNGRYALDSIKAELRQAGFRGYTWADPGTPSPWTAPTTGCAGVEGGASPGAFVSNIRQGIWGANDVNPFAANCIPNANYAASTDVLVIRRLAAVPSTLAEVTANPNRIYFQSTYERGQISRGTPVLFSPTPAPLAYFALQVYVYYIRPWSVSATESPPIPALCRSVLQSDGTMVSEVVASGIERMEIQYGHLSTAPDLQYLNAGSVPLNISSSDTTAAGSWDEVNSVRIWLLARNTTAEPGYVNATPYSMGDRPDFVPNDGFRRQLFTTVAQLRN